MNAPTPFSGGLGLVFTGAVMISFSAVFVKLAHVGPTMAGFWRTLFGGLLLLIWVLAQRQGLWYGWRDFGLSLACGVLFTLDLSFWHRSIHLLGPGLGTILSNFQVFFLAAFGALFFHERLGWRYLLALPLALTGLWLLVGLDLSSLGDSYRLGLIYGLLTAGAYAGYLLVLRRLQLDLSPPRARYNIMLISFFTALFMGLEGWWQGESFLIPDAQSWAALLGYGFFGQVLGWAIISRGLPGAPASLAGLILLTQPALAFVWDVLFFARPTTTLQALGAAGALLAIYLGTVRR